MRFRPASVYDVIGVDVVVEVRSKWCASREADHQRRCEALRDRLIETTGAESLAVYLAVPIAAWAQT